LGIGVGETKERCAAISCSSRHIGLYTAATCWTSAGTITSLINPGKLPGFCIRRRCTGLGVRAAFACDCGVRCGRSCVVRACLQLPYSLIMFPPPQVTVPVCVFAFDLLYADGEALVHLPLRARRARLAAALPNLSPGFVEMANARELPLALPAPASENVSATQTIKKQAVRSGNAPATAIGAGTAAAVADADALADSMGDADADGVDIDVDAAPAADEADADGDSSADADAEDDADSVGGGGASSEADAGADCDAGIDIRGSAVTRSGKRRRGVGPPPRRVTGDVSPGVDNTEGGVGVGGLGRERAIGGEEELSCAVAEETEAEADVEAVEKTREEAVREFLQV
jgi:hypothetical protein